MGYVELHFHLLPGIDDGPRSIEESIELARAAVADGSRTVVATPHVHPAHVLDPAEIPDRVAELSSQLRSRRIPLEVLPGGELSHLMVPTLSGSELELIAHGPLGRRWLLLEAPFEGLDADFTEAAEELRSRGFAVVIAHPERVAQTSGTTRALEHERAAGSVVQLTAWSFAGLFGEQARLQAIRLLRSQSLTVVASDAHSDKRAPALRLALDALRASGHPDPERLVDANPRVLLEQGLTAVRTALVA